MDDQIENTPPVGESGSSKPVPTWFFERTGDGFIFATDEREAWAILKNPGNWKRNDFKMLGHSDGTTYFDMIKSSKGKVRDLIEERNRLTPFVERFQKTEEKLVFEDLLDDDDEKVIKVRAKIKEYQDQLDVITKKLASANEDIINNAFQAELEIAKRNGLKMPSNHDVLTPGSTEEDRIAILTNMGKKQ